LGVPLVVLLSLFAPVDGLRAQRHSEDLLATLRQGHPRLYVIDSELPRIKAALQQDSEVKRWYDELEARARKMLSEPTVEHKLIGPRLLEQSRAALERISTLAFLYRLDGDPQKAGRARAEMLAAASFPDWNPSHFLDTAEMTHALAVGYDWLYPYLSPDDRATIRKAIVEKGLRPGREAFQRKAWWTEANHDWNQVTNGGLTLGALAIADEEPELAREMIDLSRGSIVLALRSFAPDGGWAEGPDYWNYATEYTTYYLAALESALGTDFGFKQMPGLSDTGLFRIHSIGPLGLTFNFADAPASADAAPQMFWLARAFRRPLDAQHERRMAAHQPDIFHLIWCSGTESVSQRTEPNPPLDARFRAINVAFFRSAWDDPGAVYVGFKGGDNAANHSHLDLGTFVLDACGERWALDLGPDDYDLPGYFGKLRYTYYRLRTEGHNTLTIDRENQEAQAKAPLVAFLSTPERAFAVADLSGAYAPKVKQALRGVALLNRRQVLVQDEVETTSVGRQVEIVWNFHTRATIAPTGMRATLRQGKAQLEARILSPEGARFEVISANPPLPQAQQPDVHNLVIRLPAARGRVRIAVLLAPSLPAQAGGEVREPQIEPLQAWIDAVNQKE
jgi:hypothetical protein